MQAHYPFEFEREMGCTVDELRSWLPGACGGRTLTLRESGANVAFDVGSVVIEWHVLDPRRIASITLPRLGVRFCASGVDAHTWHRFMRRFDLYTQRGGG